jgi:EAL and modified HD-GYP domain-containing signal transduction protein
MSLPATRMKFTPAAPAPAAAAVVVARQPIFDRAEAVAGFALVCPPAPGDDRWGATSNVLVRSIADIGLARLVGRHPAYLKVTRELLLAVRPLPLPREQVVLELAVGDLLHDDVLPAVLRELVKEGFRVALEDFRVTPASLELLEFAGVVKLDVGNYSDALLADTAGVLRNHGVRLIACGVETREQYETCQALGFELFQGHFFAEPVIVSGSSAPTYRLRALSMLVSGGKMTSFEQLERVIAEDPGLAHKLVRLTNSAFFGGRQPVASIRQALVTLGSVAVRRWATLLVLAGVTDRPNHLLELGLLRARLCELLAASHPATEPERAFTTGLFSVLDALLGQPMGALLDELPFDDRTKNAILTHDGPEGQLLAGVIAYEHGDFDTCHRHGVSLLDMARAYRDALDWTTDTAMQLA